MDTKDILYRRIHISYNALCCSEVLSSRLNGKHLLRGGNNGKVFLKYNYHKTWCNERNASIEMSKIESWKIYIPNIGKVSILSKITSLLRPSWSLLMNSRFVQQCTRNVIRYLKALKVQNWARNIRDTGKTPAQMARLKRYRGQWKGPPLTS